MPGRRITAQQAELYMKYRDELGQAGAAAKAGISERSGRRLDGRGGALVASARRHWRTRTDPLAGVWDTEVVPLLQREGGQLQGKSVLQFLQDQHPGEFPDSLLRTIQRRIADWRVRHGPSKDVIFPQAEEPGRIGYSDFTNANELGVTIARKPFPHLLYHFRLGYSGWSHVEVVVGGESFCALGSGLRNALIALGGVPRLHRTDSLSAAFGNAKKDTADDLTQRYRQLCTDFGMKPTRNNRGVSHENGAVESPNGHFKSDLDQALRLRGDRDFADVEHYSAWVAEQEIAFRQRVDPRKLEKERAALQPLPEVAPSSASMARILDVKVTSTATITVLRVLYTVDDRFTGQRLRVHVYDDHLDLFWRGDRVDVLPRAFPEGNHRVRVVNYHHVIESLVRKPMAFPRLTYRDELHPTPIWRKTWAELAKAHDERTAARTYLGLLLIAHRAGCQDELGQRFEELLARKELPDLEDVRQEFLKPYAADPPPIVVLIPDASTYDHLLSSAWHAEPPTSPITKEAS